ncbi:hypothetical protein [Streptomyces sp. NPDC012888]|uniref:hypothetical protein n=1 Tax=Streptomyces sp. NPDC012888 TaxID=3364855 RepID=UPI003680CDE7
MGVFDRFFRRKSEVPTDGAEQVADGAPTEDAGTGPEAGTPAEAAAAPPAAEAAEIPKQQSAEVAADNGAGEGART